MNEIFQQELREALKWACSSGDDVLFLKDYGEPIRAHTLTDMQLKKIQEDAHQNIAQTMREKFGLVFDDTVGCSQVGDLDIRIERLTKAYLIYKLSSNVISCSQHVQDLVDQKVLLRETCEELNANEAQTLDPEAIAAAIITTASGQITRFRPVSRKVSVGR